MKEESQDIIRRFEAQGRVAPVIPLRDVVFFPSMTAPIAVGRPRSKAAVEAAFSRDRLIAVFTQKRPEIEEPTEDDLYQVGVLTEILKLNRLPDGTMRVVLRGGFRIKRVSFTRFEPYLEVHAEPLEDIDTEIDIEVEAMERTLREAFSRILSLATNIPPEAFEVLRMIRKEELPEFVIANIQGISVQEKQQFLEILSLKERYRFAIRVTQRELELLEISQKIQREVKEEMDKVQREYMLRKQMEAIKRELGEEDERTAEIKELKEKIEKAGMPSDVKKEALRELDRLAKVPPAAAEYTVIRTYLDWLVSLPWSKTTRDNLNLDRAEKILNEDHYDLEKVKERILEFLAVRKLRKNAKGSILCFVGPPGVGKTSLGKSIARAMGRKFVRISLGGIRDEAEIRGHRRTYVGALPGRIIQGIRRAGSKNPVFMLDEIDKVGMDFRGDPASALLEVLDPEQNHSFVDHYLDVPFDLSKVFFIATANRLDTIPAPLLDRMEVIEIPGYTLEEKIHIARKYLVPRQIRENGLKRKNVMVIFTNSALERIISSYTREAGVRNLEREIGRICRKIARRVASGKTGKFRITEKSLEKYLGPPKYLSEVVEGKDEVGVATGLAWTPVGGEVLFVEVTKMPGNGKLILTGQLGDVMKESAQAALSYLKSNYVKFNLKRDDFEGIDIHVHVPAGAIPKDGPSAGITIFVALTSLFTGRPARKKVAMTGEITLRGRVLPVGGIKEKVLAAKRAGAEKVILPKDNEKDLVEIPQQHRKGLEFVFVEKAEEAIPIVLH